MNSSNETALLEVPLGIEAHGFAKQFAAEQDTKEKCKQVYLNTLAVYAVHRYLQWLHVETDLTQSDSWHPVVRRQWNVADLVIPEIGKLECRPVLPGETTFSLPPEVREDRIGYLGVQFSVQLLGFAEAVDAAAPTKQLLISKLQPLEALLNCLEWKTISPINVALWLRDVIDEGARRLGWGLPLPLEPAVAGWRFTQPFEQAIAELKNRGLEIPPEARGCCRKIHLDDTPLQLLAATWLLPPKSAEELPQMRQEWSLLLLLSMHSGDFLPKGIRLQVRDLTDVLSDQVLETNQFYLGTRVSGNSDERFIVTITLYGEELKLAPFVFKLD
jgi:hypothetical protein